MPDINQPAMASVVAVVARSKAAGLDGDEDDEDLSQARGRLTLVQEGRLLVQGLQDGTLSEKTLLRLVNGPEFDGGDGGDAADDSDGDNGSVVVEDEAARAMLRRRAKKIFKQLSVGEVEGVVAPEDLHEVKGRLYQQMDRNGDSLKKLRGGYLANEVRECARAHAGLCC